MAVELRKPAQSTEVRGVKKNTPTRSRVPETGTEKAEKEYIPREYEIMLGKQLAEGRNLIASGEIAEGERIRRAARDKLVETHLPIAHILAYKFRRSYIDGADLVQDAAVSLIRAADRFDVTEGKRFKTFAWSTIQGDLRHALRDSYHPIHIDRGITNNYSKVLNISERLAQELQREPTNAEIGKELQASADEVRVIFQAMQVEKSMTYLDNLESDSEEAYQIDSGENTEERALQRESISRLVEQAGLDQRSKIILKRRFYDGWIQREVGEEIGVGQMQVSRLEARALIRMGEFLDPQSEE